MGQIEELKVKIFADGADKPSMLEMYKKPHVKGLTTNPTLMKKAGITDYAAFCKDILSVELLCVQWLNQLRSQWIQIYYDHLCYCSFHSDMVVL